MPTQADFQVFAPPAPPLAGLPDASPYGTCCYCQTPIWTSFVNLPAVRRGRGVMYTLRAHDSCARRAGRLPALPQAVNP